MNVTIAEIISMLSSRIGYFLAIISCLNSTGMDDCNMSFQSCSSIGNSSHTDKKEPLFCSIKVICPVKPCSLI